MKNKILNLVGSTFLVVGVVAPIIIFNKENEENLQIYDKSKSVAESIKNGVKVKEIETAELNSAAIVTDPLGNDYLYTWGDNEFGQLGVGFTGESTHVPQKVSLPEEYKLRDLEVFSTHMGVIATDPLGDDHIYLWGRNYWGELGTGDNISKNSPNEVIISDVSEVLDLSISYYSSGVFVVDSLGREKFYAWGNDGYGELGNGTSGSKYETPQLVSTLPLNTKVKDFEFGSFTGGAIITDSSENDHLYTWGKNDIGQTGLGSIGISEKRPKEVEFPITGEMTNFSLGYSHGSISIKDSHGKEHIYMWGDNEFGQLGNNEAGVGALSRVPIEIEIPDSFDEILELDLGFNHSSVVVEDDGEKVVYMWGDNSFYSIDNSSAKYYDVPKKILLLNSTFDNYDLEIKSGNGDSFMLLTNEFGEQELYAWGLNSKGQLSVDESSVGLIVEEKTKISFFDELPQTTSTSFVENISDNEFVFEINVSSELTEDFIPENVSIYNAKGVNLGDVIIFDDNEKSTTYKFLTTIINTEESIGEYLYWSVDEGNTLNLVSKKKYGVDESITTGEVALYSIMAILGIIIILLLIIFLILVLLKRKNDRNDEEEENDYLDFDYNDTKKSKKQKKEQEKMDERNNVLDGI